MDTNLVCHSCQNIISPTYFFCPYCGKKLKSPPLSTSFVKQVGVYLFSIFIPPFGIFPGIRYLKQQDDKSKMIGVITLLLTSVSLFVNIYLILNLTHYVNQSMANILNLNLNSEIGF